MQIEKKKVEDVEKKKYFFFFIFYFIKNCFVLPLTLRRISLTSIVYIKTNFTISTRQAAAYCTWEQGHQVSCHHYLLLICWHLNQEVLTPLQGDYISMQCVTVSFLFRRLHSSRVRPTFSYMFSTAKTGRKENIRKRTDNKKMATEEWQQKESKQKTANSHLKGTSTDQRIH